MSGLEQRANDRDGAADGCCGVTLRVTGVSRSARGLAQIAEIAQILKTSMKWASTRSRDVPVLIAQIAEIILRSSGPAINMWRADSGPIENAITVHLDQVSGKCGNCANLDNLDEIGIGGGVTTSCGHLRKLRKPPFAHFEAIRAFTN
jgi:hypothetical protein